MENQTEQTVETPAVIDDKRFMIKLARNNKEFILSVPDGTPFGEAYDACLQILIALKDMINKSTQVILDESNPVEVPVIDQSQSN